MIVFANGRRHIITVKDDADLMRAANETNDFGHTSLAEYVNTCLFARVPDFLMYQTSEKGPRLDDTVLVVTQFERRNLRVAETGKQMRPQEWFLPSSGLRFLCTAHNPAGVGVLI